MSLETKCFPLGPLQENTYLITDTETGQQAVIDPGYYGPQITSEISDLRFILLTHGHYDHYAAARMFVDNYPDAVFSAPAGETYLLHGGLDNKWMAHIDDMDQLRQGIGLQAYGQRDPLVEYRMIGFDMFNEMQQGIIEDTIRLMFHIKVEQKVEREEVAKPMATNRDESAVRKPKQRENKKVYPNDPCPCGSGKKYKNCCGRKGKR